MTDDLVQVVDAVDIAAIVVAPEDDRSARAVRQYVASQLSPRSRENAWDALRRVARMVVGPGAPADAYPWPTITYEHAQLLRRGLFDLTETGAITPGTANLTLSHVRGIVRTMYGMRMISAEQLAIPGATEALLSRSLVPRLGQPDDIARAAVFLASDDASFVTGADFLVDGGLTNHG